MSLNITPRNVPDFIPDLIPDPAPKVLACDIDGTMLRRDGTLSPRVRSALVAASDAGLMVVPATGRPELAAERIVADLGLGGIWVFANGAVTRDLDRDEVVRAFWMTHETTCALITDLRSQLPEVSLAVEFERTLVFEDPLGRLADVPGDLNAVDDVLTFTTSSIEPVQKILVSQDGVDIYDRMEEITEIVAGRATVTHSGMPFLELSAEAVTKSMALSLLMDDLGIGHGDVVAFGDNNNDVDMLGWAGVGVAMGNASPEALAAADAVIATNEDDGLALAVEAIVARIG